MQNNTNDLQLASMRSRAFAYIIDDLLLTHYYNSYILGYNYFY